MFHLIHVVFGFVIIEETRWAGEVGGWREEVSDGLISELAIGSMSSSHLLLFTVNLVVIRRFWSIRCDIVWCYQLSWEEEWKRVVFRLFSIDNDRFLAFKSFLDSLLIAHRRSYSPNIQLYCWNMEEQYYHQLSLPSQLCNHKKREKRREKSYKSIIRQMLIENWLICASHKRVISWWKKELTRNQHP